MLKDGPGAPRLVAKLPGCPFCGARPFFVSQEDPTYPFWLRWVMAAVRAGVKLYALGCMETDCSIQPRTRWRTQGHHDLAVADWCKRAATEVGLEDQS